MAAAIFEYWGLDCPELLNHRGPQGPNEDIAVCGLCGSPSHSMRPPGDSFGWHSTDCSLPVDHPGYCQPGGEGHPIPEGQRIRGYFPQPGWKPDE